MVAKVNELLPEEAELLDQGTVVISFFNPANKLVSARGLGHGVGPDREWREEERGTFWSWSEATARAAARVTP